MKKNIIITILIVIVLILSFFVVRLANLPAEKRVSAPPKEITTTTIKPAQQKDIISWKDAALYYGEFKTVEGQIVDTYNSGKACFLNFHPDWKVHFTAVIFRSDFHKFPNNPEEYYFGKKVRVSGYIKEYQGKPEIILKYLSQIEIID